MTGGGFTACALPSVKRYISAALYSDRACGPPSPSQDAADHGSEAARAAAAAEEADAGAGLVGAHDDAAEGEDAAEGADAAEGVDATEEDADEQAEGHACASREFKESSAFGVGLKILSMKAAWASGGL